MRTSSASPFRRACLRAASLLILCGSLAAAPTGVSQVLDAPVKPSKDWKRIATTDVTVVGNASEGEMRTALKQIEDFRAGLLALFPSMKLTSRLATTMVVLKDFDTFRNFQPRDERGRRRENVGGYFARTPQANYMVLGAYGDREATLQTVFHEYTHYVMQQNFGTLPTWLNEGVVDFYSTFRSDYKNGQRSDRIGSAVTARHDSRAGPHADSSESSPTTVRRRSCAILTACSRFMRSHGPWYTTSSSGTTENDAVRSAPISKRSTRECR